MLREEWRRALQHCAAPLAPFAPGQVISQGVAAVEPGSELKALLQQVAKRITSLNPNLELERTETPAPK